MLTQCPSLPPSWTQTLMHFALATIIIRPKMVIFHSKVFGLYVSVKLLVKILLVFALEIVNCLDATLWPLRRITVCCSK